MSTDVCLCYLLPSRLVNCTESWKGAWCHLVGFLYVHIVYMIKSPLLDESPCHEAIRGKSWEDKAVVTSSNYTLSPFKNLVSA